jgi:hypothetical protein
LVHLYGLSLPVGSIGRPQTSCFKVIDRFGGLDHEACSLTDFEPDGQLGF